MNLPSPFCVLVLETSAGSARFHDAVAALDRPEGRPPWATWVLDAIRRTRTDVPDDDTAAWARTFWFRLEGRGEIDLPPEPCPGVRLYLPGEDAPIGTDPLTVRDAQFVLPAALGRFLRTLNPVSEPLAPVTAPATESEPDPGAADTGPAPEGPDGGDPETPPAPRTTTGTLPLLDNLTIETVAASGGGWRTTIGRGGVVVATDVSQTEPWNDPRAAGRLTAAIRSRVPLDQQAIRDALAAAFERQRNDPNGQALTSEPVARVLRATRRVTIEVTDPPTYGVELDVGSLTFTAREIAAGQPVVLNERWLGAYPRNPLRATRRDLAAILDHWLEIAEEIEPRGGRSVWETITEELATRIAPLPVGGDRDDLARYGIYLEGAGPLWVSGRLIQGVVRGAGQDPNDPGFARYLEGQGILVQRSRVIRSGGVRIRAWGLDPSFKPDGDAEIVVSIPQVEGGRP